MIDQADLRALIVQVAPVYSLDADLVSALVEQESSNDSDAWNPEPRYRYFWNVRTDKPFRTVTSIEMASEVPPDDFPALAGNDQEWWGQQASWGLMQVMGAVAREHGFTGKYLPQLCSDPALNLKYGCTHLAGHMRWARRTYKGLESKASPIIVRAALGAYNGGRVGNTPDDQPDRNREYAEKVLVRYERIRKERT